MMINAERNGLPLPDPKDRTPAVLIVEDEVLLRITFADYLQECGFKVFEAGSVAEAKEILESDRTVIDVVFTDVRLPGEADGFELARWIRKARPGLSVIMCSGDAKMAEAAKDLCEDSPFFAKPYDVAVVVAQIRSLIDRRRGESAV